ncbi:DUF438 domain-containing protein [Acetivibrio straminisolvens]|jgi:DUF438 domain-containing protein|uniref:Hemerythrin HHE cation binding domain protein n=1 Tax=Acetivibrio straminisolvens JCM 21531 TaxID=1294263 RepID=W4V997_9FIRM|nr:DUF438 domain-containing protein [Acetivibrio straminisolvens]GAE89782.1 hypothetical protein JCM21531_3342 [Acetivibrio straminisolvens JCM 21531]
MSEVINNREYRQKVLRELIRELHNGKSVEEIKPRFEELIKGISASEISEMEQALIMEGMPVEEIQRLCDVHAAVFKGSIEEIHRPQNPEEVPGHPVHTFKLENAQIRKLIDDEIKPQLESYKNGDTTQSLKKLEEAFQKLWEIDKHYSRKENLLFPYLEKYGINAPPKVMWGVDDEIRAGIKEVNRSLSAKSIHLEKAEETVNRVAEMIFKEEKILFPMALESLTEDEWVEIARSSNEIGYCLITPKDEWKPARVDVVEKTQKEGIKSQENPGYVEFDAGCLTPEEINAMLNTLPIDITFVDKDGAVKYFTQGKERIFARPKTIIGRQVQNCHPPASVHIVEKIVEDLKSGKKDHEDFWIRMGEKYVFIRYFAVRNNKGEYMGVIEVTQDIAPIQKISGEKRLLSDD